MPHDLPPLITPLPPSAWNEGILDALGAFPKSLEFVLAGWKKSNGGPVRGAHVLGTFAHHPALAKAFMTFNAHVAGGSTLPARVRELVILRASWLNRSEYEYVQHVILGARAGLTEAEIARTQQGADAPGWDPVEADCLRAVEELHVPGCIQPDTWTRLARSFTTAQLLDLIFLIGCYELLAKFINSVHMELEYEPGMKPLDPAIRQRLMES